MKQHEVRRYKMARIFIPANSYAREDLKTYLRALDIMDNHLEHSMEEIKGLTQDQKEVLTRRNPLGTHTDMAFRSMYPHKIFDESA